MLIWLWWAAGLSFSLLISLYLIRRNRDLGLIFLFLVFSGYILSSNILAPRLINLDLGFEKVVIVTGSLLWPFTSQLSDMINEVYGRRKTLYAMAFAYILNLLFLSFVLMATHTTPIWSAGEEQFWLQYFAPTGRIFVASSVSFLVCQSIDIFTYSFLKEKFRRIEENSSAARIAFLGSIRSVLSDVVNMIFDGIVFTVIAFWNTLPPDMLVRVVIGSILAKSALAVFDTPWYILFRLNLKKIKRDP